MDRGATPRPPWRKPRQLELVIRLELFKILS